MKKILLIEDNLEISQNISEYLILEGYKVKVCNEGECGLNEAKKGSYDLILLDLMLPLIDGFTIAKNLQGRIKVPIVMITAKDAIEDKLKGFDSGAVDYIIKPFDLRELEARIKIALKKNENIFKIGNMELNFKDRVFKKNGVEINLPKTEYEILKLLFENKSRVVSRTEIIEEIWGENAIFESDAKLDVYISNIRKTFDKDMLKTTKGIGYKFNL